MDQGVERTQKIVIIVAVLLGLLILMTIGYSLWNRANIAKGELARKEALDKVTKKKGDQAAVSLTGEANRNGFSFDNLTNNKSNDVSTNTDYGIVNETIPVEVPVEIPQEEPAQPDPTPVKKAVIRKKVYRPYVSPDRPLTPEEIQRIRQQSIDNSPSGNLQTQLETETKGEYKAQY
jgi:hypothetical protein